MSLWDLPHIWIKIKHCICNDYVSGSGMPPWGLLSVEKVAMAPVSNCYRDLLSHDWHCSMACMTLPRRVTDCAYHQLMQHQVWKALGLFLVRWKQATCKFDPFLIHHDTEHKSDPKIFGHSNLLAWNQDSLTALQLSIITHVIFTAGQYGKFTFVSPNYSCLESAGPMEVHIKFNRQRDTSSDSLVRDCPYFGICMVIILFSLLSSEYTCNKLGQKQNQILTYTVWHCHLWKHDKNITVDPYLAYFVVCWQGSNINRHSANSTKSTDTTTTMLTEVDSPTLKGVVSVYWETREGSAKAGRDFKYCVGKLVSQYISHHHTPGFETKIGEVAPSVALPKIECPTRLPFKVYRYNKHTY